MLYKWSVRLPKLSGQEPRTAFVYVPDICLEDPSIRLPVLYMFDGHNLFTDEDASFGKSWGMLDYLEFNEIPLIVAAVECSHEPDPAKGRLSEYSPFTFEDPKLGFIRGRGRTTMDWFVHSLKPTIDKKYPTIPGREATFVAGSSMGGLMSLYAVLQYNEVFSRAACLSPSIWFATRRLDKLIREAEIAPETVIYMDYGSREMAHHENMSKQFAAVTSRLLEKQVFLTSRIVPNGDHCEACWEEQIPFFINTLLYFRS